MKVTRGFFSLPLEEKQKHSNLVNGKEFRLQGYGGDMVVAEDQVLDWCDRLCLVVEPESRRVHSLWPTQPPSFRYRLQQLLLPLCQISQAEYNQFQQESFEIPM